MEVVNLSAEPLGKQNTSPDELTKTKKPGDVQLSEEELSKASGGANKTTPHCLNN